MVKKVLVISGSPRRKGNSAILADQINEKVMQEAIELGKRLVSE